MSADQPAPAGPLIGLFGRFGSGNFGNDGSLAAMVEVVRRTREDAQLVCICNGPERVRERFGIDAVPINSPVLDWSALPGRRLWVLLAIFPGFIRALLHTRRMKALVFPGTGVLDDYCCGPLGAPLETFLWCLAARLTGTPVWFECIGAGPIVGATSRRLMVWAAKLAQHRSYRDQASKDFLTAAGVETDGDPVYPDLAFSLSVPTGAATPARPTVCVGVMDYRGWRDSTAESGGIFERYQAQMAGLCLWLLKGGYAVRLVPGDDMDNGAVAAVRERVLARVEGGADAELAGLISAEPCHDLSDVMRQMSGCTAVISSRFHNIVCALMTGCPALSLSYSAKNDMLLAAAGLATFTQRLEEFHLPTLTVQFNGLLDEGDGVRLRIADFLTGTRADLRRYEAGLAQRLAALEPAKALTAAPGKDVGASGPLPRMGPYLPSVHFRNLEPWASAPQHGAGPPPTENRNG